MTDEELAAEAMNIDPERSTLICVFGTKGSGKSEIGRRYFDLWPYDRMVIDPTGNARPDDPLVLPMTAPFPSQMPAPESVYDENMLATPEGQRVSVWARVDPRSPTFEHDQAQALNLALFPRHRKKFAWIDEYGLTGTAQKISENARTLLMSSRHYNVSGVFICPRPRHIATMTIIQADMIIVFRVPSPDDREYIAKNAGISVPVFEREYHENQRRGPHSFLLYDRQRDALLNCPPLPDVKARGPRA